MNVASLDLCKELYKLSGWDTPDHSWHRVMAHDMSGWREWKVWCANNGVNDFSEEYFPAYDLGYLLRKLPQRLSDKWVDPNTLDDRVERWLELVPLEDKWIIDYPIYEAYELPKSSVLQKSTATPEDAAAKLAIELFKQGVLKK